MKRVQSQCQNYKTEMYKYSKEVLKRTVHTTTNFGQKKHPKKKEEEEVIESAEQLLKQSVDQDAEYFQEEWLSDKFDRFVMQCSRKDQFEKGAQVYFCYGRLSNRMMLMRYGMALEHNKYDHVHLRVDITQYLSSDMIRLLSQYKLSRLRRFKLKHTQFCIELVTFCKSVYWTYNVHSLDALFGIQDLSLEQKGLELAIQILRQYSQTQFKQSYENNNKLLTDQSIGYHQYFAAIYRVERQRIVMHQIQLMEIALTIVQRMSAKALDFNQAALRIHDLEDVNQYQPNRLLLAKYFNMIKFTFYNKLTTS